MSKAFNETAQSEYRSKRYLEFASDDELTQRLDDICGNFCAFAQDGTTRVPDIPDAAHFLALLTHFFEEMKLRRQPAYSFRLDNFHIDDARYPNARRAAQLWKSATRQEPGAHLLKFGKLKYLEPLLNEGKLRICPASAYKADSFSAAVRDDELRFDQVVSRGEAHIRIHDGPIHKFPIQGAAKLSHEAASNFYLSCYSAIFASRLFDDFEADSCLVIKDIGRYFALLEQKARSLLPQWTFRVANVQYRDPYVPTKSPNLFVTKHLRYSYQRELRAIWIPSTTERELRPLHLELGSLAPFCELLRL